MGSYSVFGPADPRRADALAIQGNPAYTGVNLHTSAQALPIPIMWGTRRISPQIIWSSTNLGAPISVPKFNGGIIVAVDDIAHGGHGWDWNPSTNPSHFEVVAGGIQSAFAVVHEFGVTNTLNYTGYGSYDFNSPNAHWFMPLLMALCEGPINSVNRIWNGGNARPIAFNVMGTTTDGPIGGDFSTTSNPPSLFYTIFVGSSTQVAWTYYAIVDAQTGGPYYSGQDLAYRGLAYIASPLVDTGHNNSSIPQQSFEVVRTPDVTAFQVDSYGIGDDYAPDAIVTDLLTSTQYGLGLAATDIDATSFVTYRQYGRAQGLYLSPLLNAQTSGVQILDRFAVETNTWIFWDGTKIRFVPLGDESLTGNGQTYTPDTTAAYDLSNNDFLAPGLTVERADPIDCHNRIRLEYSDRFSDYAKNPIEWKDETLINQFGIRDASSISADDICDVVVAAKAIDLAGKRMAYIRNLYTFNLSYRFIRILPGTIVTVTDPNLGLDHIPVRVRSVEEDEQGVLAITAEEYPGSLGIARPPGSIQPWSPTGGVTGGTQGGGGSIGSGPPVPTSGGVIIMTSTITSVLYVAGDVCTLPPDPLVPGGVYEFIHDQQRSPQPADPKLESNRVKFQRPGSGATYQFLDPQDGTAAPANFVTGRTSGTTYRFKYDGAGLLRPV